MTALSGQALSGTDHVPRRLAAIRDPGEALAAAAAATGVIGLAAGGFTVLLRRIVGGFTSPPTLGLPWVALAFGIAVIAAVDVANRTGLIGRWAGIVGRLGLVVAVLAVVPLGNSAGGFVVALVPLGLAATAVLLLPSHERARFPWRNSRHGSGEKAPPQALPLPREADAISDAPRPAGFRQRFERFQSAKEGDRVIGRLIVDVPEGSRTGHAHLGFCPPFTAVPTVDVTSIDDSIEAVVTAAEVVPWGVRVECRLAEPAEEPLAIPVDVIASHPA